MTLPLVQQDISGYTAEDIIIATPVDLSDTDLDDLSGFTATYSAVQRDGTDTITTAVPSIGSAVDSVVTITTVVPVADIVAGIYAHQLSVTDGTYTYIVMVGFLEVDDALSPGNAGLLLDAAKLALRISASTTAYDDEVTGLILAAKTDLVLAGVSAAAVEAVLPASLVTLAITTYCKAHFGYDNPDAERLLASYESIRRALALSAEFAQPLYTGLTGSITATTTTLTVSDATPVAVGDWLTVAGAGAGATLLIASVTAIDGDELTLSRMAGTTVADSAVTIQ